MYCITKNLPQKLFHGIHPIKHPDIRPPFLQLASLPFLDLGQPPNLGFQLHIHRLASGGDDDAVRQLVAVERRDAAQHQAEDDRHNGRLHAEAEYLYKTYADNAFGDVYSFDGFVSYRFPIGDGGKAVKSISPLVRYDSMNDHSDGIRYLDGVPDPSGSLVIRDYARSRITGGVTISLGTPFVSDIRINYEKYFYREGAIPDVSEKDKLVVEFMVRF